MTAEELYDKLRHVKIGGTTCRFTMERCTELTPLINDINRLKKEKNAVILAHSYVSPEIIYGVADHTGDSYGLSKDAMNADADTIIFVAVKFMGDTAKILNPTKEVLIPSELNGCSLADSITGDQVREMRTQYPEHTFVCYINTTADVKAECDVCVTSSNVYDIVERIPSDKIYFLPDRLMGENIIDEMNRRGIKKDIQLWDGTCYVHEDYNPEMITYLRMEHPALKVLSHPECSPSVLNDSDFIGSTSQMLDYVHTHDADAYLMLTECGLISRLEIEAPDKKFVGTCTMCKYMKSNTLEDIKRVLTHPEEKDRIQFDEDVRLRALECINKMFEYTEGAATAALSN